MTHRCAYHEFGRIVRIDKADKGVEYSYNENGAMTQELNKGIKKVEYDLLGYPKKVTFSDGHSIVYVYAADGRKLREIHNYTVKKKLSNGEDLTKGTDLTGLATATKLRKSETTDYVNAYVFKDNKPYMFNFQDGYYSFDVNGKYNGYHLYVKDYQGNVRLVVNGETDSIEQVNHYYPYGALMGDISTSQDFQKYKYSGKELDCQFGLDWYDFHARQQDPLLGRFTSIDPLAEKYYNISPYAYCAGDPINCIDPTGCFIKFEKGSSLTFQSKFFQAYSALNAVGAAKDINRAMYNPNYTITVAERSNDDIRGSVYYPKIKTIRWCPEQGVETDNGYIVSPMEVLQHEFDHGVQDNENHEENVKDYNTPDSQYDNKAEKKAITGTEQDVAKRLKKRKSVEVTRQSHDGTPVLVENPTSSKKIDDIIRSIGFEVVVTK